MIVRNKVVALGKCACGRAKVSSRASNTRLFKQWEIRPEGMGEFVTTRRLWGDKASGNVWYRYFYRWVKGIRAELWVIMEKMERWLQCGKMTVTFIAYRNGMIRNGE